MESAFLLGSLFGAPMWAWIAFMTIVVALLAFDLGVLNKNEHVISIKESIWLSIFYIFIACLFGLGVWHFFGYNSALEYYTGFLIEKSLSMDNVFVFALIFSFLKIPQLYQYRVLLWGILIALVARGIFIGLGATIVAQWSWVLWIFGAFLIFTGIKMLFMNASDNLSDNKVFQWMKNHMNLTEEYRGNKFYFTENGKRWFTPLFVALILVNVADIIFAVDSVPAIFAITQDPFIVYTSNIFAILGLRALYFALSALMDRFHYLKYALSLILVLIGLKIILMMIGIKISALIALSVTFLVLASGIGFSLYKTRKINAWFIWHLFR